MSGSTAKIKPIARRLKRKTGVEDGRWRIARFAGFPAMFHLQSSIFAAFCTLTFAAAKIPSTTLTETGIQPCRPSRTGLCRRGSELV